MNKESETGNTFKNWNLTLYLPILLPIQSRDELWFNQNER